jgi:hypothetical protein
VTSSGSASVALSGLNIVRVSLVCAILVHVIFYFMLKTTPTAAATATQPQQ